VLDLGPCHRESKLIDFDDDLIDLFDLIDLIDLIDRWVPL
jgi:hypothetical protein